MSDKKDAAAKAAGRADAAEGKMKNTSGGFIINERSKSERAAYREGYADKKSEMKKK